MINRRGFLTGIGAFLAAPAIIKTSGLLMPLSKRITIVPPAENSTVFLDIIDRDKLDYRYLLPLSRVELFAENINLPWAVASVGIIKTKNIHVEQKPYVIKGRNVA